MTTATAPALPRLLLGIRAEPLTSLDAYTQAYGPLPDLRSLAPTAVIELAERSGLRGHGGASFPLARKLHAVASRRGSKIVVANGSEGEPASETDRALMRQVPHLILDGAAIAARAVGAEEAIIAFSGARRRGLRQPRRGRARAYQRSPPGPGTALSAGGRSRSFRHRTGDRPGEPAERRGGKADVRPAPVRARRAARTDARAERRDALAPGADCPPRRRLVPPARPR
jgi:Respiratory-chain NADH dehydrogenase 51 Kd subunit